VTGEGALPRLDVLVVGSGVAGLSAAVRLAGAGQLRVGVLTKAALDQGTTRWAQGGIAACLGGDEDSVDLHLADTLAAGAGLCDPEAVALLVREGPRRVEELIGLGAVFDRDSQGRLELAREGGHSRPRVVHAGGAATGAEVERALVAAVQDSAAALLEGWFALELLVEGGRCRGVLALDPAGRLQAVSAERVLLASGGLGQLYAVTTNPAEATGDGLAMALRAGVPLADLEFVQFHPTALHHPKMPRPLLSEALRGHGALLRDAQGERFVDELAPRDVVSRAIADRLERDGGEHVWLDATGLDRFDQRFPTLAASVREIGLDPSRDWLPVAPAAHHLAGGILTDLDGASALPGLFAVGECACSGVHGANRLASNSLLEGMVFGARAAEAILAGRDGPQASGALAPWLTGRGRAADEADEEHLPLRLLRSQDLPGWAPSERVPSGGIGVGGAGAEAGGVGAGVGAGPVEPGPVASGELAKLRVELQRAMTQGAGVVRSAGSLARAAEGLAEVAGALERAWAPGTLPREALELRNLLAVGWAVVRGALAREETRGSQTRREFPATDPAWRLRLVQGPTGDENGQAAGGAG
jgi:L-aspartate oxidase